MNKSELRKLISDKRKSLDDEYIEINSKIICDKIISLYPDRNLCVLAYSSIRNEVETKQLLDYYKEVYLPVTDGDNMSFYRYEGELKEGNFGVGEPDKKNPLLKKPGLIIVPGVAFDKAKNRTGYGKGYYDSFLNKFSNVPKVALAFSFQITDCIDDVSINDVKMDRIITNEDDVI
ncbi:MAG: 5-formyltetrahydrofolate cyclo-ligase [Clostridia bacterium]|nr:5-formyltetrahydrofolate cyclo-ligase [Clostridia bacterium]